MTAKEELELRIVLLEERVRAMEELLASLREERS